MIDAKNTKIFLSGLLLEELQAQCVNGGFEVYRAKQILDGIYREGVVETDQIRNLPKDLKEFLNPAFQVHNLSVVERAHSKGDHSIKYLFRLSDDELVEAVWMPQARFKTICVSTQVGCPMRCSFCASGQVRFKRHLETHEMVGQILAIVADLEKGERPGHIVFMGMGEPLLNFENLLKTIQILKAPWGLGIGARKITVSTVGYVPGILKWIEAGDKLNQVRLSISLHATQDKTRSRIMPINDQYSLSKLWATLRKYSEETGRLVTFEYVLLKDVNDRLSDAQALAKMLEEIAHSVNVIEYNEVAGTGLERSPRGEDFVAELRNLGVAVTYRRSKGRDIEAACGQLRGKFIQKTYGGLRT
ncbi:MAG: 23S rRNA (adenine(2503)-C(2))-methyltransferase RlmN [Chlamydiae bacterium]|nr:23S rRNA (adenine(2503)-C(2))-methyltransferase RlmN [Chlamydiota bacterium]MBI3265876.1 23S rRNA (adenine(2503)-C(2))-methyltransferase RlmN [Chlamydiota bacterium]